MLRQIATPPMPPTTSVFAIDMPSWIGPWIEKMRPRPATGLSRSNFSSKVFGEISQPPSAIGASSAAAPVSARIGSSAASPSRLALPAADSIRCVSNAVARSNANAPRSIACRCAPAGPASSHAP